MVIEIRCVVVGIVEIIKQLEAGAFRQIGLKGTGFTAGAICLPVDHLAHAMGIACGRIIQRNRAFSVFIPAAFRLLGTNGCAPEKIFRKTHVWNLLRSE